MSYAITEKCNGCGACVRFCPADAIEGGKKKLHAIDATLCIECGACGRICPQAAVMDGRGELCVMIKRSEWLKPDIDLKTCVACGICVEVCPVGCLAMSSWPRDKGADAYPCLEDDKACIGCGFCSRECPVDSIVMRSPANIPKAAVADEPA